METQRVSPGGFAITVFFGAAIYLIVVNHGWQALLTFKTVIFLLLGMFFSVLLVGVPFHLLRVWAGAHLFKMDEVPVSPASISRLKTLVTVLMVVQVVVTFYATKLAYHWYFG